MKSLEKKKPKVSLTIHKQPSVLSNKKCETQPKEFNNLLKELYLNYTYAIPMTLSKYKEKRMETDFLLREYYRACNEIAKAFVGYYFSKGDVDMWWVADIPGTVLVINDYFFGMEDILTALREKAPKKKLFDWIDEQEKKDTKINFIYYLKGVI